MKKFEIGYTQGVYDMFHIGHLNLIKNAKKYCKHLIVGINSDRLVQEYKKKKPIIKQEERAEIVRNIKGVDKVIIVDTLDKQIILEKMHFNVLFIGNDWKGSKRWEETEKLMKKNNVETIYLPHTDGISSTGLRMVKDFSVGE